MKIEGISRVELIGIKGSLKLLDIDTTLAPGDAGISSITGSRLMGVVLWMLIHC